MCFLIGYMISRYGLMKNYVDDAGEFENTIGYRINGSDFRECGLLSADNVSDAYLLLSADDVSDA